MILHCNQIVIFFFDKPRFLTPSKHAVFCRRETKYVPSIESLDIQLSGESLSPTLFKNYCGKVLCILIFCIKSNFSKEPTR